MNHVTGMIRSQPNHFATERSKSDSGHSDTGLTNLTRLDFETDVGSKLTHYLFRFPAKFHPPIARRLIQRFSQPGDWILDPFCGSGTLLVEASVTGRNAIGSDYDPVAVFVSRMKSHKFNAVKLGNRCDALVSEISRLRRTEEEYDRRQWDDLTHEEYESEIRSRDLWVPEIPNLHHWFRNYVIVDLANILTCIENLHAPKTHKDFMRLCFASVLRACSLADPVPVSGLEVTSFMRNKEKLGRVINPFAIFEKHLHYAVNAVQEYGGVRSPNVTVQTKRCDVTEIGSKIRRPIDCVITSPPYQTAVDYYRRHQLEMYWLSFAKSQEDRRKMIPRYIGRSTVTNSHPFLTEEIEFGPAGMKMLSQLEAQSPQRAKAFKHYAVSLKKFFTQMDCVVRKGGTIVVVIGNSKVKGSELPTVDLVAELGCGQFDLIESTWYPLKDRYMSYSRRNGANIGIEHVLVFAK